MNINFIWIGSTGEKHIKALCDDYIKRISFFAKVKIKEVKEEQAKKKYSISHVKDREGKSIAAAIEKNNYVIALHPEGKSLSSVKFAELIENKMTSGIRGISFIIGGELGLSEELLNKSDFVLSLSKMTYTHDMSRIILCEQIYRTFKIMNGSNYHK